MLTMKLSSDVVQAWKPILAVTDNHGQACFDREAILGWYPLTPQQRELVSQLPENFPTDHFCRLTPAHEFEIHIPADVEAIKRMVDAVRAYESWSFSLRASGTPEVEIQRLNRRRILDYTYAPEQVNQQAVRCAEPPV